MPEETQDKNGSTEEPLTIGSVLNAVEILEVIEDLNGARNVDLVNQTGMSKGAIHKHLNTLEQAEFLVEDDGEYHLGFRFLDYGELARNRIGGAPYIQDTLDKITDETDELAYFMIEEHGRSVIVFRRSGRESVHTQSRVGKRLPMHQNAGGKAMLAYKPDAFVEEIINTHGLPEATEQTISEPEKLHEELETIRDQGYALNREESSEGIHAVSAPVFDEQDEVLGSCSVVGPKYRLSGERFSEELPELLLTVTNELNLNLKHS